MSWQTAGTVELASACCPAVCHVPVLLLSFRSSVEPPRPRSRLTDEQPLVLEVVDLYALVGVRLVARAREDQLGVGDAILNRRWRETT